MQYKAPVDSTLFLLRDVLKFDNDLLEPILTEIAKLSEESIAPTNQEGDWQGCGILDNRVLVPSCFHEPYKQFAEGGWIGLSVPEQDRKSTRLNSSH